VVRPAASAATPAAAGIRGAQFRERRRTLTHAAAVLHPAEPERPFDTRLDDEPEWVAEELRPPALACETEAEEPATAAPQLVWGPVKPAGGPRPPFRGLD
jgi:hypothetical protein